MDLTSNLPIFLKLLDSRDPAMRLTGVEALHISGSLDAIDALKASTTDADPAVRRLPSPRLKHSAQGVVQRGLIAWRAGPAQSLDS